MKATRLTLICHALTPAQKHGRFSAADDTIVPDQALRPVEAHVLTAPERRAVETAALLTASPRLEPALADCDLGRWQGVSLKHLQAAQGGALAQWLEDPAQSPHGGESITALCQRIERWLQAFDAPGDWVAVTHPMVMRAAMVAVLGMPLHAFQRIDVPPLSRLALSRTGQWRLRLE